MKTFPKISPKFNLIHRNPLSLVYLKLILTTIIWGGTFIAGRIAVQDVGVFSIAFLRFAIATLLLLAINAHQGHVQKLTFKQWVGIVFLGLTGILAYNAFFLGGLKLLPASRASLIVALNPIAIALSSAIIFRESLSKLKLFGILISLTGVSIILSKGNPIDLIKTGIETGDLLLFGCVASWVSYTLIGSSTVQDELEAFLQSTDKIGSQHENDDNQEEGYQSDNGTDYVKDPRTGNWIHSALGPTRIQKQSTTENILTSPMIQEQNYKKKRTKKAKFSNKHMRNWVYITGLPQNTSTEEISQVFSKVGIIDLDPESQTPKIKIYRHTEGPSKGEIKGDASLCFARPESVDLAIQIFDDAPFRLDDPKKRLQVQRAKFEQEGTEYDAKRVKISNAKRKVAKLAALQAVGWDESDNGRLTGGRKGLCIVVLKHMFTLDELKKDEDATLAELEKEVRIECEEWGYVEKFTIFSKNPQGVVILKFGHPVAASTAVKEFNGRIIKGQKVDACFWDGVTDFTVIDDEKEKIEGEQRHEEFGSWLEDQEIPEELHLRLES